MTDTPSHYGSSSNLSILIGGLSNSVSANLQEYALEFADNWIDSNVTGLVKSSPHVLVQGSAELKAMAFILTMLNDIGTGDLSATVKKYEEESEQFLAAYDSMFGGDENYDTMHPYASSQSPTAGFMRRKIRTTYDYNVYDYVDDSLWATEEGHATER